MTGERAVQIAIVGNGVAGLSAAVALRQAGFDPVVLQRDTGAGESRCAVELWPDTLRMLAWLGIDSNARENGIPVSTWQFHEERSGRCIRHQLQDGPALVALEYDRLCTLIGDQLPPSVVHTESTVEEVTEEDSAVTVRFANGVREQFDVVLGADGPDSLLRADRDSSRSVPPTVTHFMHLSPSRVENGAIERWTDSGAVIRTVTTADRSLGWVTLPEELRGESEADLSTVISPWLSEDSIQVETTHRDTAVTPMLPIQERTALIGRAAGTYHPLAGVGPTMAIGDALSLSAAMTKTTDPIPHRLRTYADHRTSRVEELTTFPESLEHHAAMESPLADSHPITMALRARRIETTFGDSLSAPAISRPSILRDSR